MADWMVFRAYITDFSDDVSAEWSDVKYAGRGDKFFIYNGFTRKMQVSFKVAALSAGEMKPMYNKLNFLMSNLMPDYNKDIVMRGPMMRMTIGNYIDGQLCVLNSLSYKITKDTPWEIAIDKPEGGSSKDMLILPHVIEVSLGFTPIGSLTKGKDELSQKSRCISNIAQNWNSDKVQYVDQNCDTCIPPPEPDPLPQPVPTTIPKTFFPSQNQTNPSDFTGNGNTFQTANQLRVSDQEKRYKFQYGKK
jgi:hypothetical protein